MSRLPMRVAASVMARACLTFGVAPACAQVTVQEYALPSGHFAHDVWAPNELDGPVWIAFQWSGHLRRLDPKSGKADLVPLGKGSAPHGVIAGGDGAPGFTDDGQNAKVRVHSKTSEVRRFWSDSKGVIRVSEWNSGQLSRFDPRDDSWIAWRPSGERPRVYAVYVDGADRVWASDWSEQVMLRFDPSTE